jgi:protein-S-isoprenylcysteine O-methyltransferase Ste14
VTLFSREGKAIDEPYCFSMSVRVPRWVGFLVWPVQLGTVHGAVPVELSRHGRRYGWRADGSRPGAANLAGWIPLGAGAGLITWVLAQHYKAPPDRRWAVKRGIEPEYLLTQGPYRLSRNPMHVGGLAVWAGWAVYFGNGWVAAGLAILTGGFRVGIAWEEQALERRFGDEWREYARRTPRWLGPAGR